jgi:hypothetical protein
MPAYRPLNQDDHEVRLVTILPDENTGNPLRCDLKTVRFEQGHSFQALSYAWGDAKPTVQLAIGDDAVSISETLEEALKAVRHPKDPICLWVDAICINQQNVEERNHQVRLMRQIFTCASTVNIWLGERHDGTQDAFQALEVLAEGWTFTDILEDRNDRVQLTKDVSAVFEYAWWQRLWVRPSFFQGHISAILTTNRNRSSKKRSLQNKR